MFNFGIDLGWVSIYFNLEFYTNTFNTILYNSRRPLPDYIIYVFSVYNSIQPGSIISVSFSVQNNLDILMVYSAYRIQYNLKIVVYLAYTFQCNLDIRYI